MSLPKPRARVRLTDDAIKDLIRLQRKDPQIVREIFKKMLLLERATDAGEPLLGTLVGFRKLVVGNRDYRIVWRETKDENHQPVLDIAEVWAAGARADSEVYEEMTRRLAQLKKSGDPHAQALSTVIERMGRLYSEIEAHAEPQLDEQLPPWLVQALRENLSLADADIAKLNQDQAQALLAAHWSRPKEDS